MPDPIQVFMSQWPMNGHLQPVDSEQFVGWAVFPYQTQWTTTPGQPVMVSNAPTERGHCYTGGLQFRSGFRSASVSFAKRFLFASYHGPRPEVDSVSTTGLKACRGLYKSTRDGTGSENMEHEPNPKRVRHGSTTGAPCSEVPLAGRLQVG